MLASISWPQYFAALAISGISYYIYMLLRYYHREIADLLLSKKRNTPLAQSSTTSSFGVMGAAKEDPGVNILDERELHFAESEDDGDQDNVNSHTIAGQPETLSAQRQLILEIEKLTEAFREVDSKSEFISLLNILLSSYEHYREEIDHAQVSDHIFSRAAPFLPFELDPKDLTMSIK